MSKGSAIDLTMRSAIAAASRGLVDAAWQQGELVAAEPGQEIGLARQCRRGAADGLQHLVADGVAERVVDRLEVVEIDAEHRDLLAASMRASSTCPISSRKAHAVGQIGQRVVAREVADARFLRRCSVMSSMVDTKPPAGSGERLNSKMRPSARRRS